MLRVAAPRRRMSGLASDGWACERASLPVALRVGATGFGAGVGCGVGVGFGTPLNLGARA